MVKPYSIRVKTYSSTGRVSSKKVPLAARKLYNENEDALLPSVGRLRNVNEHLEVDDTVDDLPVPVFDDAENQPQPSTYERRRIKEAENWGSLQDVLVEACIETSAMPPNQRCVACLEDGKSNRSKIRCQDCGPNQFFCHECAEKLHTTRNLFHVVEVWKVTSFLYCI